MKKMKPNAISNDSCRQIYYIKSSGDCFIIYQ
jgi:hypothetical protein